MKPKWIQLLTLPQQPRIPGTIALITFPGFYTGRAQTSTAPLHGPVMLKDAHRGN